MLDELSDLTDEISEELSSADDGGGDEKVERLGIGEYEVVEAPRRLTCHGLGSCIGIFLYDPTSGVGAGVHALLPRRGEDDDIDAPGSEGEKQSTRYTDYAVTVLYEELTKHPGVNENALIAKIAGGSEMLRFVTLSTDVGQRNVAAAREALADLDIKIEGEDVGGEEGRIVEFDPSTGGVIVRKANGEQKVI